MGKKYAVLVITLIFFSFSRIASMNSGSDEQRLNFIYAADSAGQLGSVEAQSSIGLLQNHIQWLQAQKSNYTGIFKNSTARFIGKGISNMTFLASVLLFGIDLFGSFMPVKPEDKGSNAPVASNYRYNYFNKGGQAPGLENSLLNTILEGHEHRSAALAIPVAASVGLWSYIDACARKVAWDRLINDQIKRDQDIIARLQQRKPSALGPF